MLILSRKIGERIQIGPNVFVMVCDIRGGDVKIGIEAPKEINIRRTELPDRPPDKK